MRSILTAGFALAVAGCAAPRTPPEPVTPVASPSLCIVETYDAACDEVMRISPDHIESIEVVKGAFAVELHGDRGAGGVITVQIKQDAGPSLCYVDTQESDCADVLTTARDAIDRIEVIKGRAAVTMYGIRAIGGVIHVHTRREAGRSGR